MAHLHGNEWRKSPRAIDKKNRAKAKQLGEAIPLSKIEFATEVNAPRGIVISPTLGKISLLAEGKQYEYRVGKEAPRELAKVVVPGDIVTLDTTAMSVKSLVERRNVLSRMKHDSTRRSFSGAREQVIAANIDIAVVVASAQSPPFHPKFIDRYLILLQHNDITPIVCLNKNDLATSDELEKFAAYKDIGIQTIMTSTKSNEGVDTFKDLLRGKVAVLVGHSGVGKSSLINAVDPSASFVTGEIGEKSGKGRHTTTASTLHLWDDESYIIDTPGIRSLEIWDIEGSELQYYYPEFEPFIPDCKYPDCLHKNEPLGACAVKQAIGILDGISKARYESYVKILDEL